MTRKRMLLTFVTGLLIGTSAVYADAPKSSAPNKTSRNAAMGNPASPLMVTFDFGKSTLLTGKASEAEFASIVQELNNYPYAKVEIDGYADAIGTPGFNRDLSEKRARAVREHLVSRYGIASDRIILSAYGEARPAATNQTSEGRQENRRVIARIHRVQPGTAGTEKHNL